MKRIITLTFIFTFLITLQLSAQLRDDVNRGRDFTGPIINTQSVSVEGGLNKFFKNVTMSHSYSMNFGSFGGSFQNVNAYTNTMQFALSPKLNGRVDISFLHSPFGQNNFLNNNNSLGGEVLIRNAELNYKIGDNAHIKLQYQQLPSGFGYHNPFGYNRFNGTGMWY